MRDSTFNVHPTPEQSDLLDRAAALLGKSRADFILDAAWERAQGLVLDQVLFDVSIETFQQVTALLDAPAAPSAGLRRLMAVQPPWAAARK